jgi:hypothetical protein
MIKKIIRLWILSWLTARANLLSWSLPRKAYSGSFRRHGQLSPPQIYTSAGGKTYQEIKPVISP